MHTASIYYAHGEVTNPANIWTTNQRSTIPSES